MMQVIYNGTCYGSKIDGAQVRCQFFVAAFFEWTNHGVIADCFLAAPLLAADIIASPRNEGQPLSLQSYGRSEIIKFFGGDC